VLAILGVQSVDAVIDAAHPLGPQGLPEEIELGVALAAQVCEHYTREPIPLLRAVDGIQVSVDEGHDDAGDIVDRDKTSSYPVYRKSCVRRKKLTRRASSL
jgi:hypothetical protein